jgi:hypothetical protein
MKSWPVAGLVSVLIGGCTALTPMASPGLTQSCPSPAAPVLVPSPLPVVVQTITQQYHAIAAHELEAITKPGVTPQYIGAVKAADRQASAAVTAMSRGVNHAVTVSVEQARSAVQRLATLLVNPPNQEDGPR